MRFVKQVLAQLTIALVVLTIVVLVSWHWLIGYVNSANSDPSRKDWEVSEPTKLLEDVIANDVWHWYGAEGIIPLGISRVEWYQKAWLGSDSWGYFIYYKGKLNDSTVENKFRNQYKKLPKYQNLPAWASKPPSWWNPEFLITKESNFESLDGIEHVFGRLEPDGFFIYWIKKPYEGNLYAKDNTPGAEQADDGARDK